MSTSVNAQDVVGLSPNQVLASSVTTLGRFHNDEYILNRDCLESVKEIIRFLRRDSEAHHIRRYLGQAKVIQNDLIHIIKVCPQESGNLFDLTIRLLANLTNPVTHLYRDEIPAEKVARNIYMNLIEYSQEHKEAFADIDFWKVICGSLTDLFEIDWAERSEDQCLKIEKILLLLRNILYIPADTEREKVTEKDISIHDKILWCLRQSQILEFLLYVSSTSTEQRYYLLLLDIFSLILREQNAKLLAGSEVQSSVNEREKDVKDLLAVREMEKACKKKYSNMRTFDSTLVLKGLTSFSGRDMIYHGSLEDMKESVVPKDKKRGKPRNFKMPVQSDMIERRSSFSVRLFLKEFCIEFLNCSYNNMMSVVKEKLLSGKALPNDEIYYFWGLKFFLEFNCTHNLDIKLISESVNVQTIHLLQTNMEENLGKLITEKKKTALWVRKLHLILKAYYSFLQTLKWMSSSRDESVRELSNVLKSQIFYVSEYREMALSFLIKHDSDIFSSSYLRDAVESLHLALKLLEDYTKKNKIVVQKKIRKKSKRRKKVLPNSQPEPVCETNELKWNKIKDEVYKELKERTEFPEIPPFDAALDLSDVKQKERTMRRIQELLHKGEVVDGIGLLRSARQVWPENDHFGSDSMLFEDEIMALQEICQAELGNEKIFINVSQEEYNCEDEGEEDEEEDSDSYDDDGSYNVSEKHFNIMDFKKQFAHKRIVEACSVILKSYAKNLDYTNHCVIKILFRIGWECLMPAMMYQASLFWTLLKIMNDKHRNYQEINDFTVHLFRKFTETAKDNKFMFAELLFWKDPTSAIELQEQNQTPDESANDGVKKGRKAASWSVEEEDELRKLWEECCPDLPTGKKIEWVKSNVIDDSKSVREVRKKLKELGLITDNLRSARCYRNREWLDEEIEELTKYFHDFHDAIDIVSVILDHLTLKRTKKSIREKLVELGLVNSVSQLKRKRNRCSKRLKGSADSESFDESEIDDVQKVKCFQLSKEGKKALKRVEHMKKELSWLRDNFQEFMEDIGDGYGDDDIPDSHPLLAVEEYESDALEVEEFTALLHHLGLKEPGVGRVCWKIPKRRKSDIELIVNLLSNAINGDLIVSDSSEPEDKFYKVKKMKMMTPQSPKSVSKSVRTSSKKKSLKFSGKKGRLTESGIEANKTTSDPESCDSSDLQRAVGLESNSRAKSNSLSSENKFSVLKSDRENKSNRAAENYRTEDSDKTNVLKKTNVRKSYRLEYSSEEESLAHSGSKGSTDDGCSLPQASKRRSNLLNSESSSSGKKKTKKLRVIDSDSDS